MGFWCGSVRSKLEIANDATVCLRCYKIGGVGVDLKLHIRSIKAYSDIGVDGYVVKEAVAACLRVLSVGFA